MIYLHQIANDDFSLFHADQMATEATEAVRRLKPASVVVRHWGDGGAYYHLYAALEFLDQLAQAENGASLLDALRLHESVATPTLDAYEDAEAAPPRCVVMDGDRMTGVYDMTLPPAIDRRHGDAESQTVESAPVTRLLQADFPERVALGQTDSLLVWLTQEILEQHGLPVAVPVGTKLDIVVQIRKGFALEGLGEGQLTVTDEDETLPIQFKLRATDIGPGRIRILCFQAGQPLGAITLTPTVVATGREATERRSGAGQLLAPFPLAQPDLTLAIFENVGQDGLPVITFLLSAVDPELGLNLKPFGPVKLRVKPLQYFKDFFDDIEGLPSRTLSQQAIATRELALKGAMLFQDLLPRDLRVLLWSLRDRIRTLQVLSEEPWIPWELLKLQGRNANGRVVEGSFLCEAFAVTRWFPGIGRRPELRLRRMAVVIPTDSDLRYAQDERGYLLSLAVSGQRQVTEIPANFLDVEDALSQGEYDSWHFAGHGKFVAPDPNRSAIVLEQGQRLCAGHIYGQISNCGLAQPLIFMNACQTGQQALSLTGMGGWARRFIEAGAAGFIAPLWSVYDKAAYQFTQAFYNHLLSGETIGQAVREARTAIEPLNDRWAYTVFADPLAIVK